MSNVLVLFKNNLKVAVIKKKKSFLLGIFAPLLILFVMLKILNFSSGYMKIGVIDNDNSKTTKAIASSIDGAEGFSAVKISKDEVKNKFAENEVEMVVEFNKGFEEDLLKDKLDKIKIKAKEGSENYKIIEHIIGAEIDNYSKIAKIAQGDNYQYQSSIDNYKNNPAITIEKKPLTDLYGSFTISQIFIGFLIFFMLLRGNDSTSHYFEEKNENVFNRFFIAPIKTWQYYLADLLSSYVMVLAQGGLGVIGINILNINTGIKPLDLFGVLSAIGLASVALAILVRAFSKTQHDSDLVFNFVGMILTMVGGCFVPIDILPDIINKISYFTPTRWAVECIYDLQQGDTFGDVMPYILIMLLFAAVFFVIAAYRTSREEKRFAS